MDFGDFHLRSLTAFGRELFLQMLDASGGGRVGFEARGSMGSPPTSQRPYVPPCMRLSAAFTSAKRASISAFGGYLLFEVFHPISRRVLISARVVVGIRATVTQSSGLPGTGAEVLSSLNSTERSRSSFFFNSGR